MANIQVDTAGFRTSHPDGLNAPHMALWTFQIEEQDVCFWGRYSVAEETARCFARTRGLVSGVITLVDSSGHARGFGSH